MNLEYEDAIEIARQLAERIAEAIRDQPDLAHWMVRLLMQLTITTRDGWFEDTKFIDINAADLAELEIPA